MCNVNNGGINKKFQESALSAATTRTGPRLRTIPASSTPRRKIREIAPYPVSGVSNQHAMVRALTPTTAAIYSFNGAKADGEEACCSSRAAALSRGSDDCCPPAREMEAPVTGINVAHSNPREIWPSNFSTVLIIPGWSAI